MNENNLPTQNETPEPIATPTPITEETPKKRRTLPIILGLALALVLTGGGILTAIAYEKINIKNAEVQFQIAKVVQQIPGMPKTPRFIIQTAAKKHENLQSVKMTISGSAEYTEEFLKQIELLGEAFKDAILYPESDTVDFYFDAKDKDNPKFRVSGVSKQASTDMRILQDAMYMKVYDINMDMLEEQMRAMLFSVTEIDELNEICAEIDPKDLPEDEISFYNSLCLEQDITQLPEVKAYFDLIELVTNKWIKIDFDEMAEEFGVTKEEIIEQSPADEMLVLEVSRILEEFVEKSLTLVKNKDYHEVEINTSYIELQEVLEKIIETTEGTSATQALLEVDQQIKISLLFSKKDYLLEDLRIILDPITDKDMLEVMTSLNIDFKLSNHNEDQLITAPTGEPMMDAQELIEIIMSSDFASAIAPNMAPMPPFDEDDFDFDTDLDNKLLYNQSPFGQMILGIMTRR